MQNLQANYCDPEKACLTVINHKSKKMKTKRSQLLIIVLIVLTVFSPDIYGQKRQKSPKPGKKARTETIKLFNGSNLSNWAFHLRDQSVDPSTVFTVQNGVINIKGDPFGYMRTKEAYSDYVLNLEYRWPEEATNSGVFVHAQLPDTIWLRTFECQLKAGNAGDFVCMNGAAMNEKKGNSIVVAKMAPSSEKPAGEWNTMVVTCKADTIEVVVNGVLQNRATGISESKGHICLQSEGKNIEFKNVYITRASQARRK